MQCIPQYSCLLKTTSPFPPAGELESMLRQRDSASRSSSVDSPPSTHVQRPSMSGPSGSSQSNLTLSEQIFGNASSSNLSLMPNSAFDMQMENNVSPLIPAHISPVTSPHENAPVLDQQMPHQPGVNYSTQVLWPNWPHNLPPVELLQHL